MGLSSKKNVVLIFAGLMGATLLAFQNCSQSIYTATMTSKPAKANDLSDMLKSSDKEVRNTKQMFHGQNSIEMASMGFAVSANRQPSDDPDVMTEKQKNSLKIKLKPKRKKVRP